MGGLGAPQVVKVRDTIKRQLDCSRALCLACADLGNACADAEVRDVQFQNAQHQLDEEIRKKLDDAIVHALESLDNKINPFQELEKMIMNRNRLKLDFDHYVRKVGAVWMRTIGVRRCHLLGTGYLRWILLSRLSLGIIWVSYPCS